MGRVQAVSRAVQVSIVRRQDFQAVDCKSGAAVCWLRGATGLPNANMGEKARALAPSISCRRYEILCASRRADGSIDSRLQTPALACHRSRSVTQHALPMAVGGVSPRSSPENVSVCSRSAVLM